MKPTPRMLPRLVGAFLSVLLAAPSAFAQVYSHARIVRLSFVEGTVSLQRPDMPEWAQAPVNTPLQEGFKLSTAEGSFAEVEFENASTARVGQLSLVEFTQLALMPSGGKVNRLALNQGYATFNFQPEGDDLYEVRMAVATLRPQGKARFRVDLDEQGLIRVEVFKGSVEVSSIFGGGTLGRDAVLEIRPGGGQEAFQVSKGIVKDEWDNWVEEREQRAVRDTRPVPGMYTADTRELLYGWNDLSNYGNWSSLPGYGNVWAPSVPFGWGPYTNGRWCWYPGFGYTWISAEPWGWLPYHYGGWSYLTGRGWCWIPGNFASWSPAQVVWFQGPGWIGWGPRAGSVAAGAGSGCPQVPGCTTAVSVAAFQGGKPVTPNNVLAVDPSQGQIVDQPQIAPGRLASLPGPPRLPGGMPRVPQDLGQPELNPSVSQNPGATTGANVEAAPGAVTSSSGTGAEGTTGPGSRSAGPQAAPESSITFDPAQRRFVNRNGEAPAPVAGVGRVSPPSMGNAPFRVPSPETPRSEAASAPGGGEGRAVEPAIPATRQVPLAGLSTSPKAGPSTGLEAAGGGPMRSEGFLRSGPARPSTTPEFGDGSPSRFRHDSPRESRPSNFPSARSAEHSAPTPSYRGGAGGHSAPSSNTGSFGASHGGGFSGGSSGGGHSGGGFQGGSAGGGGGASGGGGHTTASPSGGTRH